MSWSWLLPAAAAIALALGCSAPAAGGKSAPIPSRRVQALASELTLGNTAALTSFWQEASGNCPLVETIDGDDEHLLVTFLWRGDAAVERVEVRGGPYASSREPFARLDGSDVWYHSERLPRTARYVYGLVVTRRGRRDPAAAPGKQELIEEYPNDPLNPHQFNDGPVVELPGAPGDAWHVQADSTARGRLERVSFESNVLGEARKLTVYTPPHFEATGSHALAVFLDGEECERLMNLPVVLDNLLVAEKIPPTVLLLVESQGTRGRDLVFSSRFVQFLALELVPWAIERHGLRVTARETLIGGMSLGGLTAALTAHQHPEVLGNVLSQSGAFWRPLPGAEAPHNGRGWLPELVAGSNGTTVRYYLEVGAFEAPSMLENNRRLRDVLREKGNWVSYHEYEGGHDHFNWRVTVGRGLAALLGVR